MEHVPRHPRPRHLSPGLIWLRPRATNAYRREQTNGHRDDVQGFVNGALRAHVRRPHPIERYPGRDWTWRVQPGVRPRPAYGGGAAKLAVAMAKAQAMWSRCRAVRADYHHLYATSELGSPFGKNRP